MSRGKSNVTVRRPSVRLPVCPVFFLTLSKRTACLSVQHVISLATSTVPRIAKIRPIPKYQCRSNTQTLAASQLHQSCPDWWSEPSFAHISSVSQPAHYPDIFGSTSAAIIFLLRIVTDSLQFDPLVVVILDFSKIFNSVRHSTLLSRLAFCYYLENKFWLIDWLIGCSWTLELPMPVYNWLVDI